MTNSMNINRDEGDAPGDSAVGFPEKTPAADDPMHLSADLVEGDPQLMLEGLVEEYARMGCDADQIAAMFENPFFLATHSLAERVGPEAIHDCIERTLQRCGVFRFDVVTPEPVQEPRPCPGESHCKLEKRRS